MSAPLAAARERLPELVTIPHAGAARSSRRAPSRATQRWRRAFQVVFLLLNVALGVQLWIFVRFFESGGEGVYLPRPPGVEGWLPIAALMNLKAAVLTGDLPERYPAGVVLLLSFLAVTFLFRKAFCSWLCPVGTVSEWLWKLGRRVLGRTLALPRWLDVPLRASKYLLLAFFLWAVASMSVGAIRAFLASPYGVVADVKMLNFFRHMGPAGLTVLGVLAAVSVFVPNAWCRYLCPYGALHGLVSWLSPARIQRDPEACADCARCARACPARLPVDTSDAVSSPECTGCMECVAACPVKGALALSTPAGRRIPTWAIAAGVGAVFLCATGLARLTGHWHTETDPQLYYRIIPRAAALEHPR